MKLKDSRVSAIVKSVALKDTYLVACALAMLETATEAQIKERFGSRGLEAIEEAVEKDPSL